MNQKPTKTKIATRFIIAGAICLLANYFVEQITITEAQTVETKRDKPELVVQTGHTDSVNSVVFSPDGKTLASGSVDRKIKLWNVEAGQEIKSLGDDYTASVVFSPDGKRLVSINLVNNHKTFKLWKVETGQLIKSLKDDWNDHVNSVALSPDGKTLASGNSNETIELWKMETGQFIKSFKDDNGGVIFSVAFSPDGKTLASGSYNTLKLWNVETGQLIKSLEGHKSYVISVVYSPDGKTLASGSGDKTIKLWNTETGQEIKSLANTTDNFPQSIVFSPDGKTIVSHYTYENPKLWNVETGQEIKPFSDNDNITSFAFSPDGKTFASGNQRTLRNDNEHIKLWNTETGRFIKSFENVTGAILSVAFSPNGKILASGSSDKTIKLWNIETGQQVNSLDNHTSYVKSIAVSPDGKTLASGSADKTIKLWNTETGQLTKSFKGHKNEVNSVAFSPDEKTLASVSDDKTIKLWNIETGQEIKSLKNNTIYTTTSVAFSPDGKILASGTAVFIGLWNVETGQIIKVLENDTFSGFTSVVFSPDGKTLTSGSWNKTIKLWNTETGQFVKFLEDDTYAFTSTAFSPDGKTLASGSADKTIKLWNIETGQLIKTLEGDESFVRSVKYLPDGKTLASVSDETFKLWNVETGQLIKSLEDHNFIASFAFSPDGKILVSGNSDATVKLWNLDNGKLLLTLTSIDEDDWVVTTPDGRFDTNEDLNKIEGLIWVLPDQPLTPKPLELYMRQYYEPGLLARVLRCNEENNCDTEFKPLPSIAEINRVQPRVEIREIRAKANNADLVDVVVEVESRTEEIRRKTITSGVYDLRLFRDGQLVGTSAKVADLEEYIRLAPQAIEKDRAAKSLLNTEEDKAWRKANDLGAVVKFDKNKATFVFENVRLPHDGRDKIEFSAYAFNNDRVKSETSRKTFEIKSPTVRAGNTYLVSIGVNASENPNYNLNYAAVDAYKTQEILGERLKARLKGTNSKLIQIQLVSDYDSAGKLREKTASKHVIKALFNRLAGKTDDTKDIPVLIDGQKVSTDKLPAIQPEDTLIITYSGHGYADRNGIFYLLPYDIGANTEKLTTEVMPKLISSDELSLWMRDVTAREMLMIVDACHSSAAVQGDGFKPGPMASRGLGQLAYDKGMKILSATQADNVALELGGSLKQGLLSYALLQDGIFNKLADADLNKKLFFREWLKYGEKRVPKLYEGIKDGTLKSVTIDNKPPTEIQRSGIYYLDKNRKQTLQEPKLFDFNEKRADSVLINLP